MKSKKNFLEAKKKPQLNIIRGGRDNDAQGLGDACVPPQLSYFPEEKAKSSASLSQVNNKVE